MKTKTLDELQVYISNKNKFQEEAVIAAIWELQNREVAVEGADALIAELLHETKKEIPATEKDKSFFAPNSQKAEIPEDAPELYHPRFIMIFGTLFSVLGSGIMFALNFKRLGKKDLIIPTIAVSFIYVLVQSYILTVMNIRYTGISIITSVFGVYLLETLFWNKNIDPKFSFKNRAVWPPILIAALITVPLVIWLIQSGELEALNSAE